MCIDEVEIQDLQDVCNKSSPPKTGCHLRPVLTSYFCFRAPQDTHQVDETIQSKAGGCAKLFITVEENLAEGQRKEGMN